VFPVSAVTDLTGGLNITMFSYDGSLDFGLIACREMVPDVWNLIDYLQDTMEEMLDFVPHEASASRRSPLRPSAAGRSASGGAAAKKSTGGTAKKKAAAEHLPGQRATAKHTPANPSPPPS